MSNEPGLARLERKCRESLPALALLFQRLAENEELILAHVRRRAVALVSYRNIGYEIYPVTSTDHCGLEEEPQLTIYVRASIQGRGPDVEHLIVKLLVTLRGNDVLVDEVSERTRASA